MRGTLDLAARQALAKQTQDDPVLLLCAIEDTKAATTARYVLNREAITYDGDTYEARGMALALPGEEEDTEPIVEFGVDNADQALTTAYRQNAELPITLAAMLLSTGALLIPEVQMRLRNGTLTRAAIVGELHFKNSEEESVPGRRVNPTTFPGLFKPRELEDAKRAPAVLPEHPPLGFAATSPYRPMRRRTR